MPEPAIAADAPRAPSEPPPLRAVPNAPAALPAPPVPRLEIPPYELADALELERRLGVSHVLAQVLVRRGLADPEAARVFIEAREEHAPERFFKIDGAVELIEHHVRAGNRVVVHGDYDVDGVCATAIIVRALRGLGADVAWFVPSRIDDGYGLSLNTVRRLAARGTDLMVTVDCAITAVDEVAAARAAGLDVIVTDHHAPRADGRLPDCPIVHPAVCGYPCAELCGTGVAFKLAQALGAATAAEDVELVALATVADLMPLTGENRRLVREGLKGLAATSKPGLRALMAVSRVDPSALDTQALAFRLAPRINAAGRLYRADAGLELLLTEDHERATEIAAELDAVNVERRAIEQRIVWEAEAQAAELGPRGALVLAGQDWHPGVIGIVASRIVERFYRPAILVALGPEGLCSGSGRGIPGFDLLAALHATAAHLERYGGHRAAAGLLVSRERLPAFAQALDEYARKLLTPELLEPVQRVDAIVSGSELGLPLAEELEALEPCGTGNPRACLLVPGARFDDQRAMGEGRHARFSVSSGGARSGAVAFGCEGRLGAEPGGRVDATFRLERNVWKGAVQPRLVLGSARPCVPPPIEVLGEPGDYVGAALAELDAPLEPQPPPPAAVRRRLLDRRDQGPLATLADAHAAGGRVLAVCADVSRRLSGLRDRSGGFTLTSYSGLGGEPAIVARFAQVVALDPPAGPQAAQLLDIGPGFTHLAWGEAELRFALQMHELDYGLRSSLVALYRNLRLRGRVIGEELERLLRGDDRHPRSARLAGKLVRVLAELELVSLDRDLPALALGGQAQTALEHSPAYRAYMRQYEDGRRYLSSAKHLPSG